MDGLRYFLKGVQLLNQRGLRRYVAIPLLINIFLFLGLIYLGIHYFSAFTLWVEGFLPTWLHWLNWLLWILFVVSAFMVIAYTFTLIANLIAAPFNGMLSEKVEKMLTGADKITEGGWSILYKDAPRSVKRQLQCILYYLPRAILGLVLFFIPVVQVVAGPLWFLLNAWMMTIQYMDYPMDNHRVTFRDMRNLLSQQRVTSLSFGSVIMVVTMIPIVNFIVMPVSVIGATLFWVDHYQAFDRISERKKP